LVKNILDEIKHLANYLLITLIEKNDLTWTVIGLPGHQNILPDD